MSVASAPQARETAVQRLVHTTRRNRVLRAIFGAAPVFVLLAGLLIWIRAKNPYFTEPTAFLAFVRFAAPLMIVAAGQLFVIVAGEFDLSVGSLITAVVVVAAGVGNGDQSRTWWLYLLLLGLGLVVGLVNGLVTTKLGVPSFITTLATLLIISGATLSWSNGSPRGYLPDNFRTLGQQWWESPPVFARIPWADIVLVVVAVVAIVLLHYTDFGRKVFATGGNVRAARLSGIDTDRIKIAAFVISALAAVIAGILVGGLVGVSQAAGSGYEFQSITAVVLAGAVLGGGTGSMPAALAGAMSLEALFTLLNLLNVTDAYRQAFEGAIIIGAVAWSGYRLRQRT